MDQSIYESEAAVEATHWWFEGRRKLFARIIARALVPKTSSILDAGTGTGANMRMLLQNGFTNTIGIDFSGEAVQFCAKQGLEVRQGSVVDLPLADQTIDYCLATDVIEHVDDDAKALAEIARVLKPGGGAIVTVPAFQALWGYNDDRGHHKRRYVLPELRRRLLAAGFVIHKIYYFNYILFPAIWLVRRMTKGAGPQARNEHELNTPWLNAMLKRLFAFDIVTAEKMHPPFGVSILAIIEKPATDTSAHQRLTGGVEGALANNASIGSAPMSARQTASEPSR